MLEKKMGFFFLFYAIDDFNIIEIIILIIFKIKINQ